MKLIRKFTNNFKVYETEICGYPCQVYGRKNGYVVQVPYKGTPEDIKMFDNLVYYNKESYFGKTLKEAVQNVEKFIKHYQERGTH